MATPLRDGRFQHVGRAENTLCRRHAVRVLRAERSGSSVPIVIDTHAGRYVTKLRGAAQGVAALVAEIIVSALADAIGLRVPKRALIHIDERLICEDRDAELVDLVGASRGWNLGFRVIEGARDATADDLGRIDADIASRIVWLDRLVMNPDRTVRNPNLLVTRDGWWLIDHGAALPFHHRWSQVTEQSARAASTTAHALDTRATLLHVLDAPLAATLDREVLHTAVAQVPDNFLRALLPPHANGHDLARRREAYVAVLWKRLKHPRPYVHTVSLRPTG